MVETQNTSVQGEKDFYNDEKHMLNDKKHVCEMEQGRLNL